MLPPVQITDLPEDALVWDTAIAINRLDPSNIVVSYGYINFNGESGLCRAVSFDFGQTWGGVFDGINSLPTNGFLSDQPHGGFGDARGVSADKDGNFWYGATENDRNEAPIFYISTNGGIDFEFAFIAPTDFIPTKSGTYDYPQYCFGYDDKDNYGVYYVVDFADDAGDKTTQVGFIPSDASIQPTVTFLPQLLNSIEFAGITASDDGRVWLYGNPDTNGTPISPAVVSFKSTGSLNENYAGVWQVAEINFFDLLYTGSLQPSGVVSQPVLGFIQTSMQSIIYDDKREALYAIATQQVPNESQDMRIFFTISRDNGQTWSKPLNINNDNFANRGFQSMALDTERGDLVFGWYDGRNDDNFEALDYYGAVIPAATLDKLVKAIPLSNPTYIVPAVH
jgi:hypothetical protein